MDLETTQELALLLAVNCVRNTVIEDYHAGGHLSDSQMMTFNKEVCNKIYTFLEFMFNRPQAEQQAFLSAMSLLRPSNWDKPVLDEDFIRSVQIVLKTSNTKTQGFLGSGTPRQIVKTKAAPRPRRTTRRK